MNEIIQRPEFKQTSSAIEDLKERAGFITITSVQTRETCLDLIGEIKKTAKGLKAFKDTLFKPIKDHIKSMESFLRPSEDALESLESDLKQKILTFNREEEQRAREQYLKDEAERKRLADEAAKTNPAAPPPQVVVAAPPEPAKQVRSFAGTVSTTRKIKKGRIADFSKLPDTYKVADMVKVNAAAKAGIEIPGVEIYEEEILQVRA